LNGTASHNVALRMHRVLQSVRGTHTQSADRCDVLVRIDFNDGCIGIDAKFVF
jgi:hypothetical protein